MATWEKDGFPNSTKKQDLDVGVSQRFLSEESYWAEGIAYADVLLYKDKKV